MMVATKNHSNKQIKCSFSNKYLMNDTLCLRIAFLHFKSHLKTKSRLVNKETKPKIIFIFMEKECGNIIRTNIS